ncbi:MAG TPA: hypothetical protein VED40_01065 [Azospirillaceae bacterium]|nr:hypothetical protein [Azospirillaceae bacterium]
MTPADLFRPPSSAPVPPDQDDRIDFMAALVEKRDEVRSRIDGRSRLLSDGATPRA